MCHTALQALHRRAPAQVSCDLGHPLCSCSGLLVSAITCSYEGKLTCAPGKHSKGYEKSCTLNSLGIRKTPFYTLRGFFPPVIHWSKTDEMSE